MCGVSISIGQRRTVKDQVRKVIGVELSPSRHAEARKCGYAIDDTGFET